MGGILAGFVANLLTWRLLPGVSWLWWNVIGCLVTLAVGFGVSVVTPRWARAAAPDALVFDRDSGRQFAYQRRWPRYQVVLLMYTGFMLAVLWALQKLWH